MQRQPKGRKQMTEKLIVPYTMLSGAPLIPNELAEKLIENWREMERHMEGVRNGTRKESQEPDRVPVVKLFMPAIAWRWLLSELKPDNTNIAWGLADMQLGSPEMGYIHLDQLAELRL